MTPRDEKYKQYVREHPCCYCGRSPVDPHHVQSGGWSINGSDYSCIPLCRTCHTHWHRMGRDTWQREYGINAYEEAWRLLHAWITEGHALNS